MRKILIALIAFVAIFLYAENSKALIIIEGKSTAQTYAGSVITSADDLDQNYWYVDPDTNKRFLLKDGKAVSYLLKNFGQGIDNKNLASILSEDNINNIDYKLTFEMRGKFLLQVEENGEAWYINPLDNNRYFIANGKAGLKTLKKLALEIRADKLSTIAITSQPNFRLNKSDENLDFSTYWQTWDILKDNYFQSDKVDITNMYYSSLKGMADAFDDPYTQFFSPQKTNEFYNELEGSVEGIGAMVETKNKQLIISAPLPKSPAEAAGLKPGDEVWTVDGISITGFSLQDSISLIKGPRGSKVVLEIYRPSSQKKFTVSIIRDKITVPMVNGKKLNNNIAYFKINTFSVNLRNEFDKIRQEIIDDTTQGIIIDLRNNPGGYTFAAYDLADYWVPRNVMLVQEKYPYKTIEHKSKLGIVLDLPTIILVNNNTASAAEIFTTALSENGAAQVVGATTQGKGTGQSLVSFADNSSLKYTILEWLTPTGLSVEQIGFEPDYIIENSETTDLQLQKAQNLLK